MTTGKFDLNLFQHFVITDLTREAEVNLVRLPEGQVRFLNIYRIKNCVNCIGCRTNSQCEN